MGFWPGRASGTPNCAAGTAEFGGRKPFVLGDSAASPHHSFPLRPGRCPCFFPLPTALLRGSCPMEGEEGGPRLVETPPNTRDAQELWKKGEKGAKGASAAEELSGTGDTGDSGAPPGHLQPEQDMPHLEHGDGECWG